jgi:hypothetical protein
MLFLGTTALVVATIAAGMEAGLESVDEGYRGQSVSRTGMIELNAPADKAFPLFTPLLEKNWAPEWNPQIIYPANGQVQQGMVFKVSNPGEPDSVWTVLSYDPQQRRIEYLYVTPGLRLVRISIECRELTPRSSSASVTYAVTSLSRAGEAYLEGFSEAKSAERMQHWARAINGYLQKVKAGPGH